MKKYMEVLKSLRMKKGIGLFNSLDGVINHICFTPYGLVADILSNEDTKHSFGKIATCWLKMQSKNEHFDDRNQYSIETAKAIMSSEGVEEVLAPVEDDDVWVKEFCEKMSKNHRTLQQTFSGIVFYYLHSVWTRTQELSLNLKTNWWGCPFI